jgi:hypothetical protein
MKNRIKLFGFITLLVVILATVGSCAIPVTVTVKNSTGITLYYIYISPTSSGSWGSDQLGSSETLANGASKTFTITSGTYDFKGSSYLSLVSYEKRSVAVTNGTVVTFLPTDMR